MECKRVLASPSKSVGSVGMQDKRAPGGMEQAMKLSPARTVPASRAKVPWEAQ